MTSKHCWFQWFWDQGLGEQTYGTKTSLFSRAMLDFLIGAACQTAADCTFGAHLYWKVVYSCMVSRSISGKDFPLCSPNSLFKTTRKMFWLTPVVKQKIFGTRPGVQSPKEQGSQAVWEGAGTGTSFYFLPLPSPSASSLPAMGISDALRRIT